MDELGAILPSTCTHQSSDRTHILNSLKHIEARDFVLLLVFLFVFMFLTNGISTLDQHADSISPSPPCHAWHVRTCSNCYQATSPAMESARRPHVGSKWQWRYKWHKIEERSQDRRDKTWPNDSRHDYLWMNNHEYACIWGYSWLCNPLACVDLA